MCSNSIKDMIQKKVGGGEGGGVSTGGYAGPSASSIAGVLPRMRKPGSAGLLMLDNMFGPQGGN